MRLLRATRNGREFAGMAHLEGASILPGNRQNHWPLSSHWNRESAWYCPRCTRQTGVCSGGGQQQACSGRSREHAGTGNVPSRGRETYSHSILVSSGCMSRQNPETWPSFVKMGGHSSQRVRFPCLTRTRFASTRTPIWCIFPCKISMATLSCGSWSQAKPT